MPIRIVIAEDNYLVREGVVRLLAVARADQVDRAALEELSQDHRREEAP